MSLATAPETPPGPVAFFGQFGAWTHAAARTAFGPAADYRENSTISQVFDAVESGAASFGVVPIENSTEGGVNQTVDELLSRKLWIAGEVVLEIAQCLLGLESSLASIERVASHPQGLAQCRRWLAEHLPNAVQIAALSTTAAAREAAGDPKLAAISSPLAAELNGLRVLVAGIQDRAENATRFVVIGPNDSPRTGHDKTSLVFSTTHSRGALRQVLEIFDRAGLNLSRIESRPAPGRRWEYVFLTDLEGHREDRAIVSALGELERQCSTVRVLGSYPRAT
ncbi:MAG TPA: prephenate dehydratase [Polyangiaceae bacterium]|nr:prephenate dehydratase [Polyangiaceae bacterium]